MLSCEHPDWVPTRPIKDTVGTKAAASVAWKNTAVQLHFCSVKQGQLAIHQSLPGLRPALAADKSGEGAFRQQLRMHQTQQHIQSHWVTGYTMWAAFWGDHMVRKSPFPPPTVNWNMEWTQKIVESSTSSNDCHPTASTASTEIH